MFSLRSKLLLILLTTAVGVVVLSAWPAHAQAGKTLSEAEYWDFVRHMRDTVVELASKPETEIRVDLERMAAEWQEVQAVRLDNATSLPVDHSRWVAALQAENLDLTALGDELTSLLEARERLKLRDSNSLQAGEKLKQILAQPEFQWEQAQGNWLQDRLNQFLKWLAGLFGTEESTPFVLDVIPQQVISGLAAVVIALVLFYTLRTLFADFVAEGNLQPDDAHVEEPLTAQAALSRADSFSEKGDFRTAVRYLYLSALLILDERGLLYYDRTKTNREYLRSLAHTPQIADLLRSVIDIFDQVWYGFHVLDAETYRRYASQVDELKEQK